MSETTNREVIDRYGRATVARDLDTLDQLRHRDYISEYPQSGERIRGPQNARAILDNYPGGVPPTETVLVKGSADQWVVTPVGTLLRVIGTGDVYTALFTVVYPGDSRPWHMMGIFELRDSKVAKETIVFGAPFDAPAWRAQWVERM